MFMLELGSVTTKIIFRKKSLEFLTFSLNSILLNNFDHQYLYTHEYLFGVTGQLLLISFYTSISNHDYVPRFVCLLVISFR